MQKTSNLIGFFNIFLLLENIEIIVSVVLLVIQLLILIFNIAKDIVSKKQLKVGDYQENIDAIEEETNNIKKEIKEKNE